IHASPTCVMEYDGAKAWMLGAPNKGMSAMFTMMNSARLNVGLEGVAVGEAAYQTAFDYAQERKQGKAPGVEGAAPILHHADIRRTLTTMRARVMAARAICYACGMAADLAEAADTEEAREAARLREELLTPIAKAWSTDMGVETASLCVQVHGGMGFMDETLAAQLYRDARILPIYEGTNGIQAIDLAGRKLAMADGAAMEAMLADVAATARAARSSNDPQFVQIAQRLEEGHAALLDATTWMADAMKTDRETGLAGATAYLALAGDVVGGHFLAQAALEARAEGVPGKLRASLTALAGFFAETSLAEAPGAVAGVKSGAAMLKESEALFGMT
ncbi:MAG: acyl-CoA dehydrogenase, partial [Pseudomonadota bacterium]